MLRVGPGWEPTVVAWPGQSIAASLHAPDADADADASLVCGVRSHTAGGQRTTLRVVAGGGAA